VQCLGSGTDQVLTFIPATDEEPDWAEKYANSLDLIVSTVSSPKLPLQGYLSLLRFRGKFVQVGAPEDVVPGFNSKSLCTFPRLPYFSLTRSLVFALIGKKVEIKASLIGSPQEIKDMLALFAEKGVKTWNNNVPMKDANKAIMDMEAGKARYRYVLVNEKHA
jgi:alcohol dehydrogenase (NADP+)